MKLFCFILTFFSTIYACIAQDTFFRCDTLVAKFSNNRFECISSNLSYNLGILLNGNTRDTVVRFNSPDSRILAIAEKENTVAVLTAQRSGQYYYYYLYKKNENGKPKWTGICSLLYKFPFPPDAKYFDLFFLDINMVSMRDVDSYRKMKKDKGEVPEDEIFIINEDGTTEEFLKKREYSTPVLTNSQLQEMMKKLTPNKKNNSNNVKNQEKH